MVLSTTQAHCNFCTASFSSWVGAWVSSKEFKFRSSWTLTRGTAIAVPKSLVEFPARVHHAGKEELAQSFDVGCSGSLHLLLAHWVLHDAATVLQEQIACLHGNTNYENYEVEAINHLMCSGHTVILWPPLTLEKDIFKKMRTILDLFFGRLQATIFSLAAHKHTGKVLKTFYNRFHLKICSHKIKGTYAVQLKSYAHSKNHQTPSSSSICMWQDCLLWVINDFSCLWFSWDQ